MIIILTYDRVAIDKYKDESLMRNRIGVMRKRQMAEETKKRTKIAKVALTKKLEQTEKQIIVTQGQSNQTQLAE
ncbi:AraC family transcriptional regulator, partial [Vibrio owensii]